MKTNHSSVPEQDGKPSWQKLGGFFVGYSDQRVHVAAYLEKLGWLAGDELELSGSASRKNKAHNPNDYGPFLTVIKKGCRIFKYPQ